MERNPFAAAMPNAPVEFKFGPARTAFHRGFAIVGASRLHAGNSARKEIETVNIARTADRAARAVSAHAQIALRTTDAGKLVQGAGKL